MSTSLLKHALAATISLSLISFATKSPSASSQVSPVIRIGTLYAASGTFSTPSLSEYNGLRFWASEANAGGGVYVRAYRRKVPVKLIAYDDSSDPLKAGVLYNRLIARDRVNVLVADFGPALTAPAVTVAKVNNMVLFDPTGNLARFFGPGNPYIVLTSLPERNSPDSLADFLAHSHADHVGIIYVRTSIGELQDESLVEQLKSVGINPTSDIAVSMTTTNYRPLITQIAESDPDAVIEFGQPGNDAAFLRDLATVGKQIPIVFTITPGQELKQFEAETGVQPLLYTYTYLGATYGLPISSFLSAIRTATGQTPNYLDVAGYNAGLVIEKTLGAATSLAQSNLRRAADSLAMVTLEGAYRINRYGQQLGDQPVIIAQLQLHGNHLVPVIVYPKSVATGEADTVTSSPFAK